MADYRNGSGIVIEDGPLGRDDRDRGFEPGRPVDRAPGASRGRVVYRAAGRIQPPRPTGVGRLTGSREPRDVSHPRRRHRPDGRTNRRIRTHEPPHLCHRERARRQRLGARPSRRPERPLRRGRRRHRGLRAEPPPGRGRLELDEPAGRRHPARHRRPRGLSARSCRSRGSAPTRPSCCTATTTTGSPRGPTGSSSCTGIATSASSTAAASSGWTTVSPLTVDPPTYAPTGYQLPEPDFSLRAFRDDILPRLGDPELALVDVRSPAEYNGEIIAPPGMSETAQRAGPHPGRGIDPVGPDGQGGRHVQERRGPRHAVRGQGGHARQGRHRLLPDRRAVEPLVVRPPRAAWLQPRPQLRRLVDRVRQHDRRPDREAGAGPRRLTLLAGRRRPTGDNRKMALASSARAAADLLPATRLERLPELAAARADRRRRALPRPARASSCSRAPGPAGTLAGPS